MLERASALEAETGQRVWLSGFWSDGNDLEWLEWMTGDKQPPSLKERVRAFDRRCMVVANVLRLESEGKVHSLTLSLTLDELFEEFSPK